MTLEETRKRILEDDGFVLSECQKIQTLYVLKRVIRYGMTRDEDIDSESVAEHIFAMNALITYFLPLEQSNIWDGRRILLLSEFHDIDEIETGDFDHTKTDAQRALGRAAIPKVIARLPGSLQRAVTELLAEYEAQETVESRFVKAIDKLEPSFHVFSETGMKINHNVTKVTYEKHKSMKDHYTEAFPVVHRFSDVLSKALRDGGYFSP